MGDATARANEIAAGLRSLLYVVAAVAVIYACFRAAYQGRGWGEVVNIGVVVFIASVVPAIVSWLAG